MEAVDLYKAFALFSVLSSFISIWINRSNLVVSYLVSLLVTCTLTYSFMRYSFSMQELGPFYGAVFILDAIYAAVGLVVLLQILLRIVLDAMKGFDQRS